MGPGRLGAKEYSLLGGVWPSSEVGTRCGWSELDEKKVERHSEAFDETLGNQQ